MSDDDLRLWQRETIGQFDQNAATDFLICATPGAGKTRLALTLVQRVLAEQRAERVVVVVPTDALRQQWVIEAAKHGIDLMPVQVAEDYNKPGYHGCVVSYSQLAVGRGAEVLRQTTRTPTVAVLDEVHHAGERKSWGDGIKYALEHAVRRISLTGTPWRKDKTTPIPFVSYDSTGKVIVDSKYEYGEAVSDGVCRRIEFHAYDGEAQWRDCGQIRSAQLGGELAEDDVPAVLDTILSPDRGWMPGVLDAAVVALRELRREVPDAGGLVIAERQSQALAYARILQERTGEPAVVAISDELDAATRIEEFRNGRMSWLVAVRMVSEGVDIKRLAIGVYGARARTPLFFRQIVGRFVRTRPGEDVNAKLFIPAIPELTQLAKEIEDELRHQLDIERERHEKAAAEAATGQRRFELHEPLYASEPSFAESIFGGQSLPAEAHAEAEQRCREAGIPLQYAHQMASYVAKLGIAGSPVAEVTVTPVAPLNVRARREKMLRGEIKTLVGKLAHREGCEPKEINTDLMARKGYPPRAQCSIDDLERIRADLAEWLAALQ